MIKFVTIKDNKVGEVVDGGTYGCTRCHQKIRVAPGTEQVIYNCSCGNNKYEKKGR